MNVRNWISHIYTFSCQHWWNIAKCAAATASTICVANLPRAKKSASKRKYHLLMEFIAVKTSGRYGSTQNPIQFYSSFHAICIPHCHRVMIHQQHGFECVVVGPLLFFSLFPYFFFFLASIHEHHSLQTIFCCSLHPAMFGCLAPWV